MMGNNSKFSIAESEVQTLKAIGELKYFKSNFQFLNAHKGLRPGMVHVLMGSTGGGKSTLVRSMLLDFLFLNPDANALLVLSEESIESFKIELVKSKFETTKIENLFILSEQDLHGTSGAQMFLKISEIVQANNICTLFYDNITTSVFYNDKKVSDQASFVYDIKAFSQKHSLATVLIAHTGALSGDGVSRLIEENDVRGSKTVVNICEFLYIIQRFQIENHFFQTLRIRKHRGQNPENIFYRLVFERESSLYTKDQSINFESFKEAYDKRNRL